MHLRRSNAVIQQFASEMRSKPTSSEARLWGRLRRDQLGVRFRRQHPVAGYVPDFYAPACKLVVEVDGGIHRSQREYDAARDAVFAKLGAHVLRFTNNEVNDALDDVVKRIRHALLERSGSRRDASSPK